jgi:hypothetical protein
MNAIPFILADADQGKIIFYLIFFAIWIISAIAGAAKKSAAKAKSQPPRIPTTSHPLMATPINPARIPAKARKTVVQPQKRSTVRKPAAAPVPPPIPSDALIPIASTSPIATKAPPRTAPPKRAIVDAYRRRLVWAEILGKPLAMRDD